MKYLKYILLATLLIIGCDESSEAQTSTVSATVTDINGQTYNYGTYTMTLIKPTGVGSSSPFTRKDTGVALTASDITKSGSLNSSGYFVTPTIFRTDYINPTGSTWRFTVCSAASSPCFTYQTPIIGAIVDISGAISTASVPIAVITGSDYNRVVPSAYNDSQVSGMNPGSMYYNLTSNAPKWYTTSGAWLQVPLYTTYINVFNFGAIGNGVADDTTAIQNAINSACAVSGTGGTVYFPSPSVKYLITGQITIPNDGAATPKQNGCSLVGDSATFSGQITMPIGGTILEMTYNGAGVAKIDTRGIGLLSIRGLVLSDQSGSAKPFLQTTNTTVQIDNSACIGSKTGTAADQDCFIFGGTTGAIDGTSNAGFQGYGSHIVGTFFQKIRRALLCQVYCNGVSFDKNWIGHLAGSNLVGGAAVELNGSTISTVGGNSITSNTIEAANYVYMTKCVYLCQKNLFVFNGFYDPTGTTTATHRFEDNSSFNMVIVGFTNDSKPEISADATSNQNTILNSHQSQTSTFPAPVEFTNTLNPATVLTGSGNKAWSIKDPSDNSEWYFDHVLGGSPTMRLVTKPAGGAAEVLFNFYRTSTTTVLLDLNGSVDSFVTGSAQLKIRAASGSTLFLGTAAVNNVQTITAAGTTFNVGVANNGSGSKHVRSITTCTTAAAVGATCTTASIDWPGADFADANYTLTCSLSGTQTNVPVIVGTTKAAGNFTVTIAALTAAAASTDKIECIAVHD